MAEVFLGSSVGAEGFSRKVAIKRVLPGYSENESFAKMFVSEARISSHLVHPNIVSVLDFDRDPENRLFLVMELVEGKDLDALVATGLLPIAVVIFVIGEVLRGLGYAHDLPSGTEARGVVHRDVSPHNVLLSWAGAVKVSDFGIAKARAASAATASLFIKGKPAYMSPEQANGQPLDGRSDVFAVGIMLWEMLVGRRLFTGEDTRSTLAAVLFAQIPRPRSLRGDVPKDLERVTMKLLERDLSARYATAEDALHDLLDCADSPKAGREALTMILADRFQTEAPVRQSLLRARSASSPRPKPEAVAALPSLSEVRNAPTGTIDRAPHHTKRGTFTVVAAVTAGGAIATFAIVSAVQHTPDPEIAATQQPIDPAAKNNVSSVASIDAGVVAVIPIDATRPVDAMIATSPPDANSTPPATRAGHRYGTLQVTSTTNQVTVFLDNRPYGDTPRTIENVRIGKHWVRLINKDAGIDVTKPVTIRERQLELVQYDVRP